MAEMRLDQLLPGLRVWADVQLSAATLAPLRRRISDLSLWELLRNSGCATLGDIGELTYGQLRALPAIGTPNAEEVFELLARVDELALDLQPDPYDGPGSDHGEIPSHEYGTVEGYTEPFIDSAQVPRSAEAAGGPDIRSCFPGLVALAALSLDDPLFAVTQGKAGDYMTHLWLRRSGAQTMAELLALRREDFLNIRGFGPTKVARVFEYLARLDECAPLILARVAPHAVPPTGDPAASPAALPAVEPLLDERLRTVISWATAVGGAETWADALGLLGGPLPEDVDTALQGLLSLRLTSEADASPLQAFLDADNRASTVLLNRFASSEPRTLQELADQFDVTRERIRQIESSAVTRLGDALASNPDWRSVRWAIDRLERTAGSFAPCEVLDEALPGWTHDERRLTARLAGFERIEPELVRSGTSLPRPDDLPILEGTSYVIDEFALIEQLDSLGVLPRYIDFAIDAIGSVARVDGQLVLWRGTAVDKAVAVLEIRDAPQDVEQLVIAVSGDPSSRSLRNRILEDSRLMRVTKNKVGLRRWGGAMYTSVAELMRDRLAAGPMDLDELAEELAHQYEISAASVRMYASAPVFKVTQETIGLRSIRDPYVPRNRPSKVKGLYRDRPSSSTLWCLTVDRDMLRGSGRSLPPEIAVDLGIAPGDRLEIETGVGPVPVVWSETSNGGPQIGSIRALLEDASARLDDSIVLRFATATQSLELIRTSQPGSTGTNSAEIAALTNLPRSATANITSLAATIDVEAAEVVAALERRGDVEVAALARALNDGTPVVASSIQAPEAIAQPPGRHRKTELATPPGASYTRGPFWTEDNSIAVADGDRSPGSGSADSGPSPEVLLGPSSTELADEYEQSISVVLDDMRSVGYDPKALRALINAVGARRMTEMLIGLADPGEAFLVLYQLGRLDLSIEAHAAVEHYQALFSPTTVTAAIQRLADHDFCADE